jgi:HAE1 family hydrophobic/amphiphilic exporter-1
MVFTLFLTVGVISIFKIPLVLMPNIDQPFLAVNVDYPNATPLQMLESITKPLEEVLSTVPGAKQMSSRASRDNTWIELNFDWSEDIGMMRAKVRDKVDRIRTDLPDDIERIRIRNWGTDDQAILYGSIASDKNLRESLDFLELKIRKPLERVPGVAEVEIWGVGRREVNIYLRLDDLKKYRVDVGQLFQRLDDINVNRSLGRVVDGKVRYSAMTQGTLRSLREIEDIPVNQRGLRLADIADVEYEAPPRNWGNRLNGEYAVGFAVKKTSEANTIETVNGLLQGVENLRQDPTLGDLELFLWFNQGKEIQKSLTGLLSAGSTGAVLAVLVLLLFLRRLGAAMIIALAIPFSIISAVGFLYLSGKTLNVMTMLGLMLATGMLVDNAVVVLESIYQKLEKGYERVTAARVGTQEVITAVTAATLTSVIIFVPLVFGSDSDFSIYLGHAGTSIILALLCSLFISLTLIPLAMARLLRMDVRRRSRGLQWLIDRLRAVVVPLGRILFRRRSATRTDQPVDTSTGDSAVIRGYLKLVSWPLQHRALVGLIVVPMVIGASYWLLMNKVPNMTPDALDIRDVQVRYSLKIEHDYVAPVERFLKENRDRFKIKDIYSNYGDNRAWTRLFFRTDEINHSDLEGIRKEIEEGLPEIPGAEITLGSQRGENRTGFSANLFGDDPSTLEALVKEAKKRLLAHPDFSRVSTRGDDVEEEVQIRLRRDLARRYNVSTRSVAEILAIVVRGRQVRGYRTPDGQVDIIVQLRPEDREDLQDLEAMVVGAGADGEPITLSQVADLRTERVPGRIRRQDRQTSTSLWATYTGMQRDVGKQTMSDIMDLLDYPPGYGWSFSFWTNRQDDDQKDFWVGIVLALFMVYFVMASLFESLAHPFAIMFSLPFALVGVAIFLYATTTPFSMMAWIGTLVLIGIVVNNGIVLIDHVNNLRRKGMPRDQAIKEGCRERLRPIAMTAATTIVGLLPLAYGDSGMFDMKYFPLARTVMGGLLASTVLTLVVLPTYYTLFDDLAVWVKQTWYNTNPSRRRKTADLPVSGD